MKISTKALLIGIVSFVVFLFANLFLGSAVGLVIPGGSDALNAYFLPLYAAVTLLIALVISCTYLIVKKIDLLLKEKKEQ